MTEQLAIPPADPKNATEARTVLDARIADKAYGDRLLNGDAAATKEFQNLTAMAAAGGDDTVAIAMTGNPALMPTTEMHQMAATAEMFRDLGIGDGAIGQILKGEKVSPQEYELVRNWRATAMGDLDFVKRFLAGDSRAAQQMLLANGVLVNGVKEAPPA